MFTKTIKARSAVFVLAATFSFGVATAPMTTPAFAKPKQTGGRALSSAQSKQADCDNYQDMFGALQEDVQNDMQQGDLAQAQADAHDANNMHAAAAQYGCAWAQ